MNTRAVAVPRLDERTYSDLKRIIFTEGTVLSTVDLLCKSGRRASGTLVRNPVLNVKTIITVGHYFSLDHKDEAYSYVLDGKMYPIHQVFSHPRPGPFGERDIAFCIPGTSRKIKSYAPITHNTRYKRPKVETCDVIKVTKFVENIPLEIIGILYQDIENPLHLIQYDGKDGESGSGLAGEQRFFVLKGNLSEGSTEVANALGVLSDKITILTEL